MDLRVIIKTTTFMEQAFINQKLISIPRFIVGKIIGIKHTIATQSGFQLLLNIDGSVKLSPFRIKTISDVSGGREVFYTDLVDFLNYIINQKKRLWYIESEQVINQMSGNVPYDYP